MASKRSGIALLAIGAISVLNATLATINGAEKSFNLEKYINTHWITTIILFAGAAQFTNKGDYHSEVLSFAVNMASLAVCFTSIIADFSNNMMLMRRTYSTDKTKISQLFSYGFVDFWSCLCALAISVYVLKSLLKNSFHAAKQSASVALLGLGTCLIVVSVIRAFLYICDLIFYSKDVFIFRNYTLDEPAWIGISIGTGVVCVLAHKGSRLLRGVSLVCSATLIWPAMFYLWIDYRILSGTKLAFGSFSNHSKLDTLPLISIFVTIAEMITLLAILLTILSQMPPSTQFRFDNHIRIVFLIFSLSFLFSAIFAIIIEIYQLVLKPSALYASEQKSGLISALLAVFCLLSSNPGLAELTIPIALTIAILAANSTIFQIWSYLYLTTGGYFSDFLCLTAMFGVPCDDTKPIEGINLHFCGAVVHLIILALAFVFCAFLMRFLRMSKVEPAISEAEKGQCKKIQNFIQAIGVFMACGALLLLFTIRVKHGTQPRMVHPVQTIYGYIYHFSLAIPLIVVPLYQILAADNLRAYPLQMTSLLSISSVRFVSILTHMDFRSLGEPLSLDWKVHHVLDFVVLICHFASIILILRLQSIRRREMQEMEFPLDFENPLHNSGETSDGYLQLRTEEQI